MTNDEFNSILAAVEKRGYMVGNHAVCSWFNYAAGLDILTNKGIVILEDFCDDSKKFRICVASRNRGGDYNIYVGYSEKYIALNAMD